jgi:hypothetical protein
MYNMDYWDANVIDVKSTCIQLILHKNNKGKHSATILMKLKMLPAT